MAEGRVLIADDERPARRFLANLLASMPDVEVVAMTSFIEEEKVTAALEAGASGYLLKQTPPARLLEAITDASGFSDGL